MSSGLPACNGSGVLPPYLHDPASPERSPYKVDLVEVVQRFGTSSKRRQLLDGLLRWRSDLRAFGSRGGTLWLDGSFVEELAAREPNDIDVVAWTFMPPPSTADYDANRHLFDRTFSKPRYGLDVFVMDLRSLSAAGVIERVAYWYGLFSHRRSTFEWKGLIEVPLDGPDEHAKAALAALSAGVRVV